MKLQSERGRCQVINLSHNRLFLYNITPVFKAAVATYLPTTLCNYFPLTVFFAFSFCCYCTFPPKIGGFPLPNNEFKVVVKSRLEIIAARNYLRNYLLVFVLFFNSHLSVFVYHFSLSKTFFRERPPFAQQIIPGGTSLGRLNSTFGLERDGWDLYGNLSELRTSRELQMLLS